MDQKLIDIYTLQGYITAISNDLDNKHEQLVELKKKLNSLIKEFNELQKKEDDAA